jgi:hypothetical protein
LAFANRFKFIKETEKVDFADFKSIQNQLSKGVKVILSQLEGALDIFKRFQSSNNIQAGHVLNFQRVLICNRMILSTTDWDTFKGIVDVEFKYHVHYPNIYTEKL